MNVAAELAIVDRFLKDKVPPFDEDALRAIRAEVISDRPRAKPPTVARPAKVDPLVLDLKRRIQEITNSRDSLKTRLAVAESRLRVAEERAEAAQLRAERFLTRTREAAELHLAVRGVGRLTGKELDAVADKIRGHILTTGA